jgi:hypothetical protein
MFLSQLDFPVGAVNNDYFGRRKKTVRSRFKAFKPCKTYTLLQTKQ